MNQQMLLMGVITYPFLKFWGKIRVSITGKTCSTTVKSLGHRGINKSREGSVIGRCPLCSAVAELRRGCATQRGRVVISLSPLYLRLRSPFASLPPLKVMPTSHDTKRNSFFPDLRLDRGRGVTGPLELETTTSQHCQDSG